MKFLQLRPGTWLPPSSWWSTHLKPSQRPSTGPHRHARECQRKNDAWLRSYTQGPKGQSEYYVPFSSTQLASTATQSPRSLVESRMILCITAFLMCCVSLLRIRSLADSRNAQSALFDEWKLHIYLAAFNLRGVLEEGAILFALSAHRTSITPLSS